MTWQRCTYIVSVDSYSLYTSLPSIIILQVLS